MRSIVGGIVVAGMFWLGAHALEGEAASARAGWPRTETTSLVPPVELAQFAPYRELLADLLWCRLLVYYGSNWGGEGDLSQVEDILDDIVVLDPKFKAIYEWAGFAVAYRTGKATQEEFRSSVRYLELGMKAFPDEYKYPWQAGARYYFDLWSPDEAITRRYRERGAELIERAMTRPNAPQDIATTAANMRSKLGQYHRALDNLREMIASTSDDKARRAMLTRVRIADPDLADELAAATADLQASWLSHMPMVPLDFFILLGPAPPTVIDLGALTTPRDLFGVGASAGAE
ncbi:MAG TPA: hypothetical protein VK698_13955 [Kofleriaceae bacterium]|nr:hypothetical protein [Kofleriaceae bacterium]